MTAFSAHAVSHKVLCERLADQWEALDNADRLIVNLGDEISDAKGQRRDAHAHIDSLTAQIKDLGID
jgi:hypothetical protein